MSDKKWARKVFEWRGNKSTFRKETNRNMKIIDMKIVNNNENMDITIKGQGVGKERKIQNRVKQEIKNEGLKKWKANMEKKKSLRWHKNKEKPKMKKIYNGSWKSTLLFKARTDSLEVNEKRKKWGGDKDSCEKCEIRKERNTETLDHVLIECPEYKSERLNFETEVKRTIGDREWETIKQGEDKGMEEILGLGDYGRKMTDIAKKYLATIWKKRKLNKKGQKNNRAENKKH